MLKTVTGSILVHRQVGLVLGWVFEFEGFGELHAGGKTLPWVVSTDPEAIPLQAVIQQASGTIILTKKHLSETESHLQRVLSTIPNLLQPLHSPLLSLVKARFIEAPDVCEMDLQPSQTGDTKRAFVSKLEQATAEIIADVVEMGRDRISSASEIEVVREVELVREELHRKPALSV